MRALNKSKLKCGKAGNLTRGACAFRRPATLARINIPLGFLVDANRGMFFSDFGNNLLRYIAPNGTISTVAGNRTPGMTCDGQYLACCAIQCRFCSCSLLWRWDSRQASLVSREPIGAPCVVLRPVPPPYTTASTSPRE